MSAWHELRQKLGAHRELWAPLAVYVAGGWVALEIIDVLTSVLRLPDWFPAVGLGILVAGLPIVVATAFVQARRAAPAAVAAAGGDRLGPDGRPIAYAPDTANDPDADPAPSPSIPAASPLLRRLTWRNTLAAGIAAFAAWGVFAAVWLGVAGAASRGAAMADAEAGGYEADRVVVVPFTVRGGPEYGYLGEAMVNLLATALDEAGALRTVDARAALGYVDGATAARADVGAEAARKFRAATWVTGDIVEAGGELQISAAAYRAGGEGDPIATVAVEGPAAQILALVDHLASRLLGELGGGPAGSVRQIAAMTTDSLEALKAFLDGESLYRSGRFDEASDAFRRAVDVDSSFALAYYRLSLIAEWNLRGDLSAWAAERAVRYADRLPDHERTLLEAMQVRRTGDNERAARMYRAILSLYPEDREALIDLAEILIHAAPLRGGYFGDSREAFEKVLALDPEHSTSLLHLARVAAAEGDLVELDSLTRKFLEVNPTGDRGLEIRTLQAFAHDDVAAQDAIMQRLSRLETSELSIALAAWDVATYARNLDGAERIIRLLLAQERSFGGHTLGHSWLAQVYAARGRVRDAHAQIAELATENPGVAREFDALLALAPYAVSGEAALREVRVRLRATDPAAIPESDNPNVVFSALDGLHPVILAYLDGLLSARLGDAAGVADAAGRLRAAEVPAGAGYLNDDLALAVEAERAWQLGDPADAFARLDRARRQVWYGQTMASPYFAQARERYLQGELLVEMGRDAEALPWFEHLVELGPFELAYYPMAELRQAEIHDRAGQTERARAAYRRFLELWKDADPQFAPVLERARAALDALPAD